MPQISISISGTPMNGRTHRRHMVPGRLLEVTMSAALVALSLVLFLFKFPYPPAPFLKFDGMGVPLAVLALYSLRSSVAALPIVFAGLHLLGADFVGASMKLAAETSTFIAVTVVYRRCATRMITPVWLSSLSVTAGLVSRVATMTLLNYIVTPYWMVLAYGMPFEKAHSLTISLLPHIAVFNAIAASYVGMLAVAAFRVVSKTLGLSGHRPSATA